MEKSFLPHILYTYIQNLFKFRFISTYHPLLSFIEEEEEEGRKGLFPRVSTSCEGMKSGASKEGGERERESSSFWKRRLERERERIRNSLWSASDWRFCIAEADVQPLAESTFSFSSRCEACRVASRATGLVPPLQETRWLVPSLDYPDYCSNKIGGGRKEGRRGNRNLRNEQGCSRLVAIFLQEEIEIVLRLEIDEVWQQCGRMMGDPLPVAKW